MTLQTLPGVLSWPGTSLGLSAIIAFGAGTTIDASGEYDAYIFEAREDMVVDRVGFKPNAATGSPTAELRIETVSAGVPSGTLWNAAGGGSTGTTGTLSTSSMNVTTLAAAATISKRQIFAVVIKYATGTSFVTTAMSRGGLNDGVTTMPYKVTNVTGSAVASVVNSIPLILGSSSTNFYRLPACYPITAVGTINPASNGVERAVCLRFQLPFKCRIIGARALVTSVGTTEDFSMGIYTDAGSEVSSSMTTFAAASYYPAGGASIEALFDNSVTPTINTWYRLVYQPDTTLACTINYATLEDANHAKAIMRGLNAQTGTRDSGGAWTDVSTRIPMMDLIIDQLDDGAGSGGGAFSVFGG